MHLSAAARLLPNDPNVLYDLGSALAMLERPDEALTALEGVLAADAGRGDAWTLRGDILRRLDRLADAIASYDRALVMGSATAAVLNNRGLALAGLGRLNEAIEAYDQALAVDGGYTQAWCNRGQAQQVLGRFAEALDSYDRALACDAAHPQALNNRGALLRSLGKHNDALRAFDQALSVMPDFVEALNNRALSLFMMARPEAALPSLDRALALRPSQAQGWNLRGLVLVALNRPLEALESYERALAVDPDCAEALGNKGLLLVELGQAHAAKQALERAIALSPKMVRAHYNLTLSKRLSLDDPAVRSMQALEAEMPTLSEDDQIHLHFALGKVLADNDRMNAAFIHFQAGARLKRRLTTYDEGATLDGVRRRRAAFSQALLRQRRGWGDPSPSPVFILGMPRSGTTLVEQILATHPQVFAAGETDAWMAAVRAEAQPVLQSPEWVAEMSAEQTRRLGERYLSLVGEGRAGALRLTNKTPDNFNHIGLIHLALPNARVVHVRRDPIDTCLSCFSKLFGGDLPYTYDLAELGRYYRAYEGLMDHWRKVLPKGVMIDVAYEDLVAKPERQVRRILAHCGLPWEPACLNFHQTQRWIHTASAAQVREPIHQGAIGRWRIDRSLIEPLLTALGLTPQPEPEPFEAREPARPPINPPLAAG
jgi:tetratricopeptide (TPR) repeat protein